MGEGREEAEVKVLMREGGGERGGGYADDLFRSKALPAQLTLTVTA